MKKDRELSQFFLKNRFKLYHSNCKNINDYIRKIYHISPCFSNIGYTCKNMFLILDKIIPVP